MTQECYLLDLIIWNSKKSEIMNETKDRMNVENSVLLTLLFEKFSF